MSEIVRFERISGHLLKRRGILIKISKSDITRPKLGGFKK
jgi:hypothetical protein